MCAFVNNYLGEIFTERDSTAVWSCDTLKKEMFLVTNVFSVSKLILWYLYKSSIDLATRFTIGMHLLNREKRYAFSRLTDIIQVFNSLPTDKIYIKVRQDRLLCPTYVDNKKKNRFLWWLNCAMSYNRVFGATFRLTRQRYDKQ